MKKTVSTKKTSAKKVMTKKSSARKMQDIDRAFILIPDADPDQWRRQLDIFFDENEVGLDHIQYMKEMGRGDVDCYYFTSGYEMLNLFPEKVEVGVRVKPKKSKALVTRMGTFTMVYENTGCFRYAMPEEPVVAT
jgi:hypothetical protein